MKILETVTKRPLLVAGIGGGVLLMTLLSRNSSSSGDYTGYALESQRLANDVNLGIAGLQVDATAINMEGTIARNNAARDIILGGIEARSINDANQTSAMASALANLTSASVAKSEIRANESVIKYQTDSTQTVALAGMSNDYAKLDRSLSHEAYLSDSLITNYNKNLPAMQAQEITMQHLNINGALSLMNEEYRGEILLAQVTGTPARIAAQTDRSAQRTESAGKAIGTAIKVLFGG